MLSNMLSTNKHFRLIISSKLASFYLLSLLALSLFCAGCGNNNGLMPVAGVITLEGNPLPGAVVCFQPIEGGRPSIGTTDENGSYELTYIETGDGALLGSHQVTVTALAKNKSTPPLDEKATMLAELTGKSSKINWLAPKRYSNLKNSGLSFVVKQGEKNVANFDLKN